MLSRREPPWDSLLAMAAISEAWIPVQIIHNNQRSAGNNISETNYIHPSTDIIIQNSIRF
jgi:hypothetical protein